MGYAHLNHSRFSRDIYLRGEDYAQMGNVSITSFTGTQAKAIVDGTYPYEVKIEFNKDNHILRHFCTCPYHAKGKCCKHIAAVLFALDELPASQMVQKYPLEEDSKYIFQDACGWSPEEFQTKSIESFTQIINSPMEDFEPELRYFFRAAFSQYGYKKQKEQVDTFCKIMKALEGNDEKRRAFVLALTTYVESNSTISAFFSKTLFSFKSRTLMNQIIRENPNIVEELLNGDFVSAINPMNVFSSLDEDNLCLFGKSYYFSYESDEQTFIDACEESDSLEPLQLLLKRTKLGSDPASKRILAILNKDATSLDAYRNSLDSYADGSMEFFDLFETLLKLTEEEKEEVKEETLKVTARDSEHHSAVMIALGERFSVNDIQRIPFHCMLTLADTIENKGEDFVDRSVPKRIEKEIKYCSTRYFDENTFTKILETVKRFAKYPLVVNALRDSSLHYLSLRTAFSRKQYLETLDSLGLLKANGVYPFHEVGLCF